MAMTSPPGLQKTRRSRNTAKSKEVILRDPVTQRFMGQVAQPIDKLYPTMRKHCGGPCGRWRYLVDFSHRTNDMPHSWCKVCRARSARKPTSPPRLPPTTQEKRAQRKLWNDKYIQKIRSDPDLHQELLETKRIQAYDRRRAAGIPKRNFTKKHRHHTKIERVCPDLFIEWMGWIKPVITDVEYRAINRYENNKPMGLDVELIDSVMTRYGASDQFNVFDSEGWPSIKAPGVDPNRPAC